MSKSRQFNPIKGVLLVKPLEREQLKGYDIPNDEERPQLAEVVKVGGDTYHETNGKLITAPCKIGDIIIHSSVGFENIKIEDEEFRVVPFTKVLMVK